MSFENISVDEGVREAVAEAPETTTNRPDVIPQLRPTLALNPTPVVIIVLRTSHPRLHPPLSPKQSLRPPKKNTRAETRIKY